MNSKSKVVSILGAGLILLSSVAGASAQNNTSAQVELTVQAQSGGLSIVQVQQSTQFTHVNSTFSAGGETNGGLTVEIRDARFTRSGWSLNIAATDFSGTTNASNKLAVSQMSIQSVAVKHEEGDPAPPATTQNATMSTNGVKIVSAPVGAGSGRYTVSIGTKVVVPANTSADKYKTTVTFTLDAAP